MATIAAHPKHRKKDLLYHVIPSNNLYVQLETKPPEGLTLDLQKGTWTFGGSKFPIGQTADWWGGRVFGRTYAPPGTPYGVYDRTNIEHLRRLIEVHENLAEERGGAIPMD